MSDSNKVVWSEGLFLRTQHLQQQDRYTEGLVRGALQAAPLQSFGFRTLVLDKAALDAGRVAIASATGIFPDGTSFAIPETADAPSPAPIRSDMSGIVSLAVPIEKLGAATIDPAHAQPAGSRYRGVIQTVRDAVRGGAEPEEVEVARLAARLILPGEEAAGYVALPVARVDGLRADGSVVVLHNHVSNNNLNSVCVSIVAAEKCVRFGSQAPLDLDRIFKHQFAQAERLAGTPAGTR